MDHSTTPRVVWGRAVLLDTDGVIRESARLKAEFDAFGTFDYADIAVSHKGKEYVFSLEEFLVLLGIIERG